LQVEDKFENISFHFTIEVYVESINYAQKRATVTIWASIHNCSYSNATAITIIFDGDAHAFVKCERFGFDYYWGHTSQFYAQWGHFCCSIGRFFPCGSVLI